MISRWSAERSSRESAESDIRADDSSGPSPSCSSFEKRDRAFSSVRSTAVRMRLLSSCRCRFRRSMYLNSLWAYMTPIDRHTEITIPR